MTIRPAQPADYPVYAALFPELAVSDTLPSEQKWNSDIAPFTFMAEDAGTSVGLCFWQRFEQSGYVRQLMVAPSARRRGVGRALLLHVAQALRRRGATEWRLNVKPENRPAVQLYESLGMRVEYASTAVGFDWSLVERLPETPGHARVVSPTEDAAIEAAFRLPRGQLQEGRARHVVMTVDDGGAPRGIALFDPSFPGAFPFRVAPGYAHALLEGLRAHRRPDLQGMGLVIEDDAPLVEQLTRLGAHVRLHFVHMAGPLPVKSII